MTYAALEKRGYWYALEATAAIYGIEPVGIKRLARGLNVLQTAWLYLKRRNNDHKPVWARDLGDLEYCYMFQPLGPEDVSAGGTLCSRIELIVVANAHLQLRQSWSDIIIAHRTGTAMRHANLAALWSCGSHVRTLAAQLGEMVRDWASFRDFVQKLVSEGKFEPSREIETRGDP